MLPAAASFKKQGANKGALASFLISTPESGVDSIAITYALLDPIMTIIRPLAAFVTGISAGFLENIVSGKDISDTREKPKLTVFSGGTAGAGKELTSRTKLKEGMKYAFGDVWGDIMLWFFAGLLLAGIITVYIPDDFSHLVLGGGIVSMLTMLVIGMPIYICATASTPIAAALLLKGASPGAVMVLLLAGPATNMTSLSVLIKILGKMGTIRYLLVIAVVSILIGLGLDGVYRLLAIEPRAVISEVRELLPFWLKLSSALILLLLSVFHLYGGWLMRRRRNKQSRLMSVSGFPEIKGHGPGSNGTSDRQGAGLRN